MNGFGSFLMGVGAALTVGAFGGPLGRMLRPAARNVIKQGIILSRGAQVRAAEMREDLEDLVAEAQAEAGSAPSAMAPEPTTGNGAPAARR